MASDWWAAGLLGLSLLAGHAHAAQADSAEAKHLAALAPAAMRHSLQLTLKATNGQAVRFDSQHPANDSPLAAEYVDYRLAGATPDGRFFVVSALAYESETLFWVSRATGRKVEVFAPPDVSPGGRYAVTALHWEAFDPEGVFIWEIAGDSLLPRGHLQQGNYGLFTFKRWTGADTAELELYSHDFLRWCPAGTQSTTATVRLARGAKGWALAEPASAHEVKCE